MTILPTAPIVILARPQMGENIGSAARAMMNCGLTDLRLVAPRDGWPNPAALPMAAGGSEIIENARVYDNLADAAYDVSLMVAASARRRDLPIKSADLRAAAMMMLAHDRRSAASPPDAPSAGRVAMLFGPEASGLDNDEVVLADILVTAPLNPSYPSLNLAQAVLLMAWEWRMAAYLESQHGDDAAPDHPAPNQLASDLLTKPVMPDAPLASIKERDFFFQRLETALDDGGFFTAPNMSHVVKRNLRAFFTRAAPSAQEISTLHGVIQALTRKRD
ncbi:RNA methyltransferase [Alphaproteobacteria bacterium]|nr:RNA methyltransferase [Alphaproteobacteria bacterium]